MKNRLLSFIFLLTLVFYGIAGYHFLTAWHPIIMMLVGIGIGTILNALLYGFFSLLGNGLKQAPQNLVASVLSGIVALVALKLFGFGWPDSFYYAIVAVCVFACIIAYWFLNKKSLLSGLSMVLALGVLIYLLFVLANAGSDPYEIEAPMAFSKNNDGALPVANLANPAKNGPFAVKTFTYGSGTDEQRTEYASGVKFKTATVDASSLIPEWKGKKKKWRERYWGFGEENFPLNGRVYMPEGEGPFPLTLIVHGNHSMIDYSDDGYGYLGNLLASRGIIAVSIDQNFINGHWSGDFMGKEMPVRAWLLLKHLELWRNWNGAPEHELSEKVDVEHIMLIGHSRGGEAVSIAAAYNKLPYFPDNAIEKFDFNFNIKGVVALAPTDYRYDRKIDLENINFLSLQGSYDADEVSFWGLRPYHRLQFTDSISRFKSGVYIHHANHGQFNSTWGNSDFGAPAKWLLNLEPLLEEVQQQETAKVFISAFAEAALKNNLEFLPIFKNVALGKQWLPKEHYLTHFEGSNVHAIADFEEDIDVTTAADSSSITTKNLALWKEQILKTRNKKSQENSAVILGWDLKDESDKTKPAVYKISLSESKKVMVQSNAWLQLSIAAGDHKWLTAAEKEEKDTDEEDDREVPELDFSIQLTDALGKKVSLKVSAVKQIPKPLKTRFTKFKFLEEDMIGEEWEVQLQTFHFPLEFFAAKNTEFNLQALASISLVFDQGPYGVVVVDDISISN